MSPRLPDPAWHWPRFDGPLCGTMTDRERLGLPDRYLPGRFDAALAAAYARLRGAASDALLRMLVSIAVPLAERIAAGNLLALIGDPRLNVECPDMVDIPAGIATVGLAVSELSAVLERYGDLGLDPSWIEKECPRHTVALHAYRIARFPVTNLEYRAFLLDTAHPEIPTSWPCRQFPPERANHPVHTIGADSADAYARWLAQRTGRAFRLPTESEWEWAASGPAGLEFPWGERFDADLANTAETGLMTSTSVGVFVGGESPFGLHDMAGNVEEYVADDYTPYPGGARVHDHLVRINGRYRIARGGSFARFRDLARTRRRHGHNPRSALYVMGFRLAESI